MKLQANFKHALYPKIDERSCNDPTASDNVSTIVVMPGLQDTP
jgi:hypothetical protein